MYIEYIKYNRCVKYIICTSGICTPWDFSGKNTETGCHFLLQGVFPTQGSKRHHLHLLHCRQILYH